MNKSENLKLREINAETMSASAYRSQIASSGSGSGNGDGCGCGSGSGSGSGSGDSISIVDGGSFSLSPFDNFWEHTVSYRDLKSFRIQADGRIIQPEDDDNICYTVKIVAGNGYTERSFNSIDLLGVGAVIDMNPKADSHLIIVRSSSKNSSYRTGVSWSVSRRKDY